MTEVVQPNATPAPKHAGGRPRKISRKRMELIATLIEHGVQEGVICEAIGINRVTLFRAKKDRQFCNMVLRSKSIANGEVIKSLYLRAIGYSHPETKVFCHEGNITEHEVMRHYPPDVGAITLWLINQTRGNSEDEGGEWRKEIQHEETRVRPAMFKIFERVSGKEVARVMAAAGSQVAALLGPDFVSEVQENGKQHD